jgi:predicted metal-dependent hydrolase
MPAAERRAALEAGLAAYAAGDFFLAHELLEPPWMGTRDLPERELIQGVIKLAAAFVHGARSNPAGIEKNLRGARERIANGLAAGPELRIDASALLRSIDDWLADPTTRDGGGAGVWEAIEIRRLAPKERREA